MSVVYVDSSTLLRRVLAEPDADTTRQRLRQHLDSGDVLASSSLAWVEVSRAVRRLELGVREAETMTAALSGIAERPIDHDVVSLARRIGPPTLRSLEAIHLASALVIDADVLLSHDTRVLEAAAALGLATGAP